MTGSRGLVQADDGWTIVTKGPSGRRKPAVPHRRQSKDDENENGISRRINELAKRYDKFQKLLRSSQYWSQIRSLLAIQECPSIDSAVCLGLGSLENEYSLAVSSLWQLVLFQEVTDYFQAKEPTVRIARYAQDPKSNAFDKAFLKRTGVDLLDHPAAIEKITERTFLFDPFLPWAVMLVDVLPGRSPAFYIGSTMGGILDLVEDPSSPTAIMRRQKSERKDADLDKALCWVRDFLRSTSTLNLPADFEHHEHAYRGFLMIIADNRSTTPDLSITQELSKMQLG